MVTAGSEVKSLPIQEAVFIHAQPVQERNEARAELGSDPRHHPSGFCSDLPLQLNFIVKVQVCFFLLVPLLRRHPAEISPQAHLQANKPELLNLHRATKTLFRCKLKKRCVYVFVFMLRRK